MSYETWMKERRRNQLRFLISFTALCGFFVFSYYQGWVWLTVTLVWTLFSWGLAGNKTRYNGRYIYTRPYQFYWYKPLILAAIGTVAYFIWVRATEHPIDTRIPLTAFLPCLGVVSSKNFWLRASLCKGLALSAPEPKRISQTSYTPPKTDYAPPPRPENRKDPYRVLSLDKTASNDKVKKRYYELLHKLHPDKSGVASTSPFLQEVIDAYNTIKQERGNFENDSQSLIRLLRTWKPRWLDIPRNPASIATQRLELGERGENGLLARYLTNQGLEARTEVSVLGNVKTDIVVRNKWLVEAKQDIGGLTPLGSLKEKMDKCSSLLNKYELIILVYGVARADLEDRLLNEAHVHFKYVRLGRRVPAGGVK